MASTICNGVDYRKRLRGSEHDSDSSSEGVAADSLPRSLGWRGDLTVESMQNLYSVVDDKTKPVLALVLVYGIWNTLTRDVAQRLEFWFRPAQDLKCQTLCAQLCVSEESVEELETLPPAELPALAVVTQKGEENKVQYLNLGPTALLQALQATSYYDRAAVPVQQAIQSAVRQVKSNLQLPIQVNKSSPEALRIFVAGDRSSVGKSSVCLGILGNLLQRGYAPSDLAYIKPATQSESPQLIQIFCESKGIECVPIGPLVYYRGFTRAFLAGETAPTEQLLESCGAAVDRLARGKQVVLMDGVGFPAVGSICGTDNAAVAMACSYPMANGTRKPAAVLIVGGSGVGSAVDGFNLNATYFERAQMPVIGAIFNKLSTDPENFYSLEKCKEQVTKYFDQNEHQRRWNRRPFGFCPLYDNLKGGEGNAQLLSHADEWIKIFGQHVDVGGILQAAQRIKANPNLPLDAPQRPMKKFKAPEPVKPSSRAMLLTRQEIEQAAIRRGAPVSA